MKLITFLLSTIAATYIFVLLTDYIYKKTNDNTYVYITLAVFVLTGVFMLPAIICFFYRRVYRQVGK